MLPILLGVSELLRPCCSTRDLPHCLYRSYVGSEDCLFLNVYAPQHANNLPVFVFIRMYPKTCVLVRPSTATCLHQTSFQMVERTKLEMQAHRTLLIS